MVSFEARGNGRERWYRRRTFMIRSGRNVPTPAMPMPDFAVPYAAPAPVVGGTCQFVVWYVCVVGGWAGRGWTRGKGLVVLPKIMADAIPA